MPLVIWLFGSW